MIPVSIFGRQVKRENYIIANLGGLWLHTSFSGHQGIRNAYMERWRWRRFRIYLGTCVLYHVAWIISFLLLTRSFYITTDAQKLSNSIYCIVRYLLPFSDYNEVSVSLISATRLIIFHSNLINI